MGTSSGTGGESRQLRFGCTRLDIRATRARGTRNETTTTSPTAKHFEPVTRLATKDSWFFDGEFESWFNEWEVSRLGFDLQILTVIHFEEAPERTDHITECGRFTDIDAFHLVKRMLMGGVDIFVTKYTAITDTGNRLARFELGLAGF